MMPRPQSRRFVVFPLGGRLLDEDEIIVHSCSFPCTRFEYLGIISRAKFPSVDSKLERAKDSLQDITSLTLPGLCWSSSVSV